MRQLGYPPGYLDEVEDEDEPSGITIFDDETKTEYEDGELPEKGEPVQPEKKMTVEFPGINAPIPENADHHRWAQASVPSGSSRKLTHHRPNHLTDTHKGQYPEHLRNDGPTGGECGSGSGPGYRSSDHHRGHYPEHQRNDGSGSSYLLSDSHRDHYPSHLRTIAPPGTEHGPGSSSIYSPRHSHYDHNSPSPIISRNSNLDWLLYDRGRRSSIGSEGSPLVHSPLSPHPIVARQSPSHRYHSPSASLDHWTHNNPYSGSPDVSSLQQAGRERHDQQHHHRRHHRN